MALWPPKQPGQLVDPSLPSTLGLTTKVTVSPDFDSNKIFKVRWLPVLGAVRYIVYVSPSPMNKNVYKEVGPTHTQLDLEIPMIVPDEVMFYFWVGYINAYGAVVMIQEEPVYMSINSAFESSAMSTEIKRDIFTDDDMKFYAEEIRRRNLAMLQNDGENFTLYIRRMLGAPCVSLDPTTGQRVTPMSTPFVDKLGTEFDGTKEGDFEDNEAKDPEYQGHYRCANCVPPDTLITMGDFTLKRIDEIKIGDEVITHNKNVRHVTKIFSRPFNGPINAIHTKRGNLLITDEHPVWTLKAHQVRKSENNLKWQIMDKVSPQFEKAIHVRSGDCLVVPRITAISVSQEERLFQLLGYYAAEGCADKKYEAKKSTWHYRTRFAANHEDMHNVGKDIIDTCVQQFQAHPRIEKVGDNCQQICVHVRALYDYVTQNVVGRAINKYLSAFIMQSDHEQTKAFMGAVIDGDGHCAIVKGRKWGDSINCSISTASKNMAYQYLALLEKIGIPGKISQHVSAGGPSNRNKRGTIYCINIPVRYLRGLHGHSYKITRALDNLNTRRKWLLKESPNVQFNDNYILYSVVCTNKEPYEGVVMNLEVEEDNSYVANGFIVHNCLGTGIVGGYYPGINVRVRYGNLPRRIIKLEETGIEVSHDFSSWTVWHPRLKERDVLVRVRTNERFVIKEVGQSEWRGMPLHQEFNVMSDTEQSMIYEITDDKIRAALEAEGGYDIARWDWGIWA